MEKIQNKTDEPKKVGGARPGSGRPVGRSNKISAREILEECENIIGKPLAVSLLEGYRDTILDGDRKHRVLYEKILLDKCASNLLDVEVTDTSEAVAAKQAAFTEALRALQNNTEDSK